VIWFWEYSSRLQNGREDRRVGCEDGRVWRLGLDSSGVGYLGAFDAVRLHFETAA
jgi:hypothetical protein